MQRLECNDPDTLLDTKCAFHRFLTYTVKSATSHCISYPSRRMSMRDGLGHPSRVKFLRSTINNVWVVPYVANLNKVLGYLPFS